MDDQAGYGMVDAEGENAALPAIEVPAVWTLGGLAAGLLTGLAPAALPALAGPIRAVSALLDPLGGLWLKALQMTILPLVAAVLVIGITQTMRAASAGAMARRTLGWIMAVYLLGAAMAALAVPALLDWWPIPGGVSGALKAPASTATVPGLGDFLLSILPSNVVSAAANDALLPCVSFFVLLALAIGKLPPAQQAPLTSFFNALGAAMTVMIGWVLALAPLGVFALGLSLATRAGASAIGVLAHYIALVSGIGGVVLVAAYVLVVTLARVPLVRFARAMLPAEAVAISTQSSLASLPAMLGTCRDLGVRQVTADFVLPLSVALFRGTGPAMNLAVAIYVAKLTGVALTPGILAAGVLVAALTEFGAPSLPGSISFVSSVGPVALAMGVPIGPLALLVAVEMLPDLMRTVGNVAMDVAVAVLVDRAER
jgi:Na+/H+-dicarboxylate symporter